MVADLTPFVFQMAEWLLVLAALSWAARASGDAVLNGLAFGLNFLMALYLLSRLVLKLPGPLISPGKGLWVSFTQAVVAGILVFLTFFLILFAVTRLALALAILSGSPPENPPETPEKSVNISGGQTPILH